jgi:ATP-dependent Clp protease ATP-binding subunit ClpA
LEAVNKHFTPEFRNRLDAIIEFNRLEKPMIRPIVIKFIEEINSLLEPKDIRINIDESAILKLIEDGFDEKMGARPMKRIIAEKIKKPLSKRIVFENLSNTQINVRFDGIDYEISNT